MSAQALAGVEAGGIVRLDGPEGRHAVAVRRVDVGERVHLVDGLGRRATGQVDAIVDRAAADIRVESVLVDGPPQPRIIVVQALPKGERGELAVELLTEIGADEIVPWAAANCVAQWRGEKKERGQRKWSDAAHASAKQARRARFPVVAPLASTAEVLDRVRTADVAVVLHEDGARSIAQVRLPRDGTVVIVVGPEGGLSPDELAELTTAGAQIVRLGPTVLRTSSAGIAAVAALLAPTPRWADARERGMEG
jgi:16S rRNA (uracil1498-N3)-methyltransferase